MGIPGRRSFLKTFPLIARRPAAPSTEAPSRSLASAVENRLHRALDQVEIIDTLEHSLPERERTSRPFDFFSLASNVMTNCVSAGMPPESVKLVEDASAPLADRWRAFEPFWRVAGFTGLAQTIRTAVREIYGVDRISGATLPAINAAIARLNKPGLYRHLFKERARIRMAVLDVSGLTPLKPDPELFVLMRRFDNFITPASAVDIGRIEKATRSSITSLAGLKQAMEKNFQEGLDAGMVSVKTLLGYQRDLSVEDTGEAEAARDFENLMKGSASWPVPEFERRLVRPFRRLEDHMLHHLVRLAEAHRIPVFIHTGWLGAETPNFIQNANPVHLTKLVISYPRVKFNLLHVGYPYHRELSWLVQARPNVYVDLCFAWDLSPTLCRRLLDEFLEMLPVNKILGFGGDRRFPELTFANARTARATIAAVLADKVRNGFCDEDDALMIGRMLLHDNAAQLVTRRF